MRRKVHSYRRRYSRNKGSLLIRTAMYTAQRHGNSVAFSPDDDSELLRASLPELLGTRVAHRRSEHRGQPCRTALSRRVSERVDVRVVVSKGDGGGGAYRGARAIKDTIHPSSSVSASFAALFFTRSSSLRRTISAVGKHDGETRAIGVVSRARRPGPTTSSYGNLRSNPSRPSGRLSVSSRSPPRFSYARTS